MALWADAYYHGVKQDLKSEGVDADVSNIFGASKVTRSGRLFSPEISPPTVHKPVVIPSDSTSTTAQFPSGLCRFDSKVEQYCG